MTLRELQQKRAQLIAQARAILDKGEMKPDDQAAFDAMMAEADGLKAQIDRLGAVAAAEAELNSMVNEPRLHAASRTAGGPGLVAAATPEYQSAFWNAMRQNLQTWTGDIRASLQVGVNTEGGYLVPQEFETRLVEKLLPFNIMRQLATVITTSSDRNIPVETDIGAAAWTDENAAYSESDTAFNRVTLGAYKLTRIIKVSEELLQDAFFDIESYIADAFGRTFGVAEEQAFINGDGTGKPTGVLGSAAAGATTASGTAIAADDLIELFHALKRQYRVNAKFVMADQTAKAVRKLKDSMGQYIWQPGLQAGEPDVLLGKSVYISDYMPTIAVNNRTVLFGDFSYYRIADRRGRTMQRLNELYAANGQVGFKMMQRTEGKLLLQEGMQALVQAAA